MCACHVYGVLSLGTAWVKQGVVTHFRYHTHIFPLSVSFVCAGVGILSCPYIVCNRDSDNTTLWGFINVRVGRGAVGQSTRMVCAGFPGFGRRLGSPKLSLTSPP